MDRQVIEEAKDAISLLDLAKDQGIELRSEEGERAYCRCPFHDDDKPSMMITNRFAICYAAGCGWSGDIVDWIKEQEDLDFISAMRWLCEKAGIPWETPAQRDISSLEIHQKQSSYMKVLEEAAKAYAEAFEDSPAANYVRKRGIDPDIAVQFGLGWCSSDSSLMGDLIEAGYKPALIRDAKLVVGKEKDFPRLADRLVIPIRWWGKVVNLYGRAVSKDAKQAHDYLLRHRMCFGWDECRRHKGIRNSSTIFAAEGIIDALVLWSAGIPAIALYGTKSIRKHWARRMYKSGIRRMIYVPDADSEIGLDAAMTIGSMFLQAGVKVLVAPMPEGYDPADLGKENYKSLRSVCKQAVSEQQTLYEFARRHELLNDKTPSLFRCNEQAIYLDSKGYSIGVHSYRNTRDGLSAVVSLHISDDERHRDKLNTWASRSRNTFVKLGGLKGHLATEAANRLMKLDAELRRHEKFTKEDREEEDVEDAIDEELREQAIEFLKDPKLLKNIERDISRMGYVGEPRSKLLTYLIATGRLMLDPLHACIMSQSSSGKSHLVNTVAQMMPEESVCMISAMSSRALYHLDEDALVHRWVIMAERTGYDEIANHAVRLLQSEGHLRYLVATKDEATGLIDTQEKIINGPMAWSETTTDQENELNPENLNRMVVIYLDETSDQTRRIHKYQRKMAQERAIAAATARQKIIEVHRTAQRLLRAGLRVTVPYSDYIEFPVEQVRARRDFQKVMGLISISAILHQYQRKQSVVQGVDVVHSTVYDYRIAYELYATLLRQAYTGLPKKSEELLNIITEQMTLVARKRNIKDPGAITFRRRDIQEWSNWGARVISKAMAPLEEQEVLDVKYEGGRGNPAVYTLSTWSDDEGHVVSGMTHPDELEKKWRRHERVAYNRT